MAAPVEIDNTPIMTLEGHTGHVESVAIFPDGDRIVSGSHDGTLKIWNAHTGEHLRTLEGHTRSVRCVALFPDNTKIVSANCPDNLM